MKISVSNIIGAEASEIFHFFRYGLLVNFVHPEKSVVFNLFIRFIPLRMDYSLYFSMIENLYFLPKYDLVALKNPTMPMYYLRIKKGRKVLCLIQGEQLEYETRGMYRMRDPSIPDKCTLKMKRNLEEKVLYFTIETGRKNRMGPFQKLRFKMKYEE